jgi:hypothetical protein
MLPNLHKTLFRKLFCSDPKKFQKLFISNEYEEQFIINSTWKGAIIFSQDIQMKRLSFHNIYTSVIVIDHNDKPLRYSEIYRYTLQNTNKNLYPYVELQYHLLLNNKKISHKLLPKLF